MSLKEERIWAGSEANLQTALEAEVRLMAGHGDTSKDNEEEDCPRLLSVADGLATITIKGPLVNSDSPYLKYYGVTGYPKSVTPCFARSMTLLCSKSCWTWTRAAVLSQDATTPET